MWSFVSQTMSNPQLTSNQLCSLDPDTEPNLHNLTHHPREYPLPAWQLQPARTLKNKNIPGPDLNTTIQGWVAVGVSEAEVL